MKEKKYFHFSKSLSINAKFVAKKTSKSPNPKSLKVSKKIQIHDTESSEGTHFWTFEIFFWFKVNVESTAKYIVNTQTH